MLATFSNELRTKHCRSLTHCRCSSRPHTHCWTCLLTASIREISLETSFTQRLINQELSIKQIYDFFFLIEEECLLKRLSAWKGMGIVQETQQGVLKYFVLATVRTHFHIRKEQQEGQVTQNPDGENSQVM